MAVMNKMLYIRQAPTVSLFFSQFRLEEKSILLLTKGFYVLYNP